MKNPKNTPGGKSTAQSEKTDQDSLRAFTIVLIVISGILFLILLLVLIGGVIFMKSYKNNLEAKYQQDSTAMQNYIPANESSNEKNTQNGRNYSDSKIKAKRYPYNNSYLSNSTYYWNCKYHYSLSYPKNWTIDDQGHNAMQVFVKGSGVTVKIESIGLVAGETLRKLADRRNEPGKISSDAAGVEVWSEVIDWDGQQLIETHYVKPDAIILHWLEGGRGMEVMIFGSGFNNSFTEIEKMLATLGIGITNVPTCSTGSSSIPPKKSSAPSESSFDCASWIHPNGDLEYWWDQASPQEKNCYVTKYGAPPFYEP